jgi:hypothetical protein
MTTGNEAAEAVGVQQQQQPQATSTDVPPPVALPPAVVTADEEVKKIEVEIEALKDKQFNDNELTDGLQYTNKHLLETVAGVSNRPVVRQALIDRLKEPLVKKLEDAKKAATEARAKHEAEVKKAADDAKVADEAEKKKKEEDAAKALAATQQQQVSSKSTLSAPPTRISDPANPLAMFSDPMLQSAIKDQDAASNAVSNNTMMRVIIMAELMKIYKGMPFEITAGLKKYILTEVRPPTDLTTDLGIIPGIIPHFVHVAIFHRNELDLFRKWQLMADDIERRGLNERGSRPAEHVRLALARYLPAITEDLMPETDLRDGKLAYDAITQAHEPTTPFLDAIHARSKLANWYYKIVPFLGCLYLSFANQVSSYQGNQGATFDDQVLYSDTQFKNYISRWYVILHDCLRRRTAQDNLNHKAAAHYLGNEGLTAPETESRTSPDAKHFAAFTDRIYRRNTVAPATVTKTPPTTTTAATVTQYSAPPPTLPVNSGPRSWYPSLQDFPADYSQNNRATVKKWMDQHYSDKKDREAFNLAIAQMKATKVRNIETHGSRKKSAGVGAGNNGAGGVLAAPTAGSPTRRQRNP